MKNRRKTKRNIIEKERNTRPPHISMRFKSPDTLGDLIEELDEARSRVFGVDKKCGGNDE